MEGLRGKNYPFNFECKQLPGQPRLRRLECVEYRAVSLLGGGGKDSKTLGVYKKD